MKGSVRTHGLWEQSAPPPPETVPLRQQITADVVVIGAGFTGLSTALHLAEAGKSVVVLEDVEIGFGGSGRNVGLVNPAMWVKPDMVMKSLGPVYGHRILHDLGNAPALVFETIRRLGIACEATPNGTLHCAVDAAGAADLAQREAQWRARGAPVELLDAAAVRRATGGGTYHAALLDHRAGTIQPLAYARGLATAAIGKGVRIFTGSAVTSARETPSGWDILTADGRVSAQWVVVATNAYTNRLWPEIRHELVPLNYFNCATPPLPPEIGEAILPGRQGVWDTASVLSSYRKDARGRLVFGSVGALRGAGGAAHRAWAMRAMAKLFPTLRSVGFEHEWFGTIGMTSDAVPRFHRFAERVISVSGYNGRGIAPGTSFGRTLAHLILGQITPDALPLPVTDAAPIRGRFVRETFYEAGAVATHLVAARI